MRLSPDSIDSPTALMRRFLQAFESLDLAAFIDCFADDATAFFPQPEPPRRFDGRAAIRVRFERVFAAIRSGAPSGPPYHRLDAEDPAVQILSPGAAVVTFHLRNDVRLARRTPVLALAGKLGTLTGERLRELVSAPAPRARATVNARRATSMH